MFFKFSKFVKSLQSKKSRYTPTKEFGYILNKILSVLHRIKRVYKSTSFECILFWFTVSKV